MLVFGMFLKLITPRILCASKFCVGLEGRRSLECEPHVSALRSVLLVCETIRQTGCNGQLKHIPSSQDDAASIFNYVVSPFVPKNLTTRKLSFTFAFGVTITVTI